MYPETIEYNGVTYSVNVDYSAEGEINYFQLTDDKNEFFFEMDWEGGFTAEDVISLIDEER